MDLVLVDSTINNLKALAVAVSAGKSICVCGPVGCGKTTLVQYLASVTGNFNLSVYKFKICI